MKTQEHDEHMHKKMHELMEHYDRKQMHYKLKLHDEKMEHMHKGNAHFNVMSAKELENKIKL